VDRSNADGLPKGGVANMHYTREEIRRLISMAATRCHAAHSSQRTWTDTTLPSNELC
jgi:hypothetical protein